MVIIQSRPSDLSLVGNMIPFVVETDATIRFTLKRSEKVIVDQVYSPGEDHLVEIDLRETLYRELNFLFNPGENVYEQSNLSGTFTALIDDQEIEFTVVKAGVANLSDTARNWLGQHFLTWQPRVKPVTYYSPEWITYYAVENVVVKLKAFFSTSESEITLGSVSAGKACTFYLQYAYVSGLLDNRYPNYYEVWVEGNTVRSESLFYRFDSVKSNDEQWFLFENSLGGIDTLRASGSTVFDGEHDHKIAGYGDFQHEYNVDAKRKYKKNTGYLDSYERQWLLDFFPSRKKYVYGSDGAFRRITVSESTVAYTSNDLPSDYTFTYYLSEQSTYLNLTRDADQQPREIVVPDIGSPDFSFPPRLSEFPRISLDEGVILPAFSSSGERATVTTLGILVQFMQQRLNFSGGGTPHTHGNLPLLEKFTLSADGRLLFDGKGIDVDLEELSKHFLSKTKDDSVAGLITFIKGFISKTISVFESGLKSLDFVSNMLSGSGFGIYRDSSGKWHLEIDFIEVRKTLKALQLIIQEVEVEGGIRMQGSAIMMADRVDDLGDAENSYRIYFDNKNGKLSNQFTIGAQARCHRVNTSSELGISYYWRVVKAIGTDYIDVYKNNVNTRSKLDPDTNATITFPIEVDAGSSEPLAGDVIVGCGHVSDTNRMAYIITTTIGDDTPKTEEWSFVNDFRPSRTFNLSKLRSATKEVIQADQVIFRTRKGERPVSLPVEEWTPGLTAHYPEQYTFQGSTWLCLASNVTSDPNSSDGNWLCTVSKGDEGDPGKDSIIVIVESNNGKVFKNGVISTTLTARVYRGEDDISLYIHSNDYRWIRTSGDASLDEIWNANSRYGRTLIVSPSDLDGRATFNCDVNVGRINNTIQP